MDRKTSYANGKLLITGEYLVLSGALALAVPTIPGQEMTISRGEEAGILLWESYYHDEKWFEARFSLPALDITETSDTTAAGFIRQVFKEALRLRDRGTGSRGDWETGRGGEGIEVVTRLGFHPEWGLGSSSSLIHNLAKLLGIDPFTLFFSTQQGSGFDIACASASKAILYRLENGNPVFETTDFRPPFAGHLALVYSGRKQRSAESVGRFRASGQRREIEKGSISAITREIVRSHDLPEFMSLVDEHEKIMSKVLDTRSIKDLMFADFPGSIKSLGAWGGDFILAAAPIDFNEIKSYFSAKRLNTVFKWEELIRGPKNEGI